MGCIGLTGIRRRISCVRVQHVVLGGRVCVHVHVRVETERTRVERFISDKARAVMKGSNENPPKQGHPKACDMKKRRTVG